MRSAYDPYWTMVAGAEVVVFEYRLIGAGFSEATFRFDDTQFELGLGDSPDPLKEPMAAALAIARGEIPPEVLWDPEDASTDGSSGVTGEHRIGCAFASLTSPPMQGRAGPGRPHGTVLSAECLARAFCSAFAEGAAQVITRYGPDRHVELWLSPFPFELLDALQAAVAQLPG